MTGGRPYSDRTVDVLDIRFLDDDFFCHETKLTNLRLGQRFAFSQLSDLPGKRSAKLHQGPKRTDRDRSSRTFVGDDRVDIRLRPDFDSAG
jgi:hypothetical protein